MPFIQYVQKTFSEEKMELIAKANLIINGYQKQGFSLTLRQLYYVFVSNDLFPDDWTYRNAGQKKWVKDPNGTKNAPPNYNALSNLVSDARMAGFMDWDAIVDRSRSSYANQHWERPSQAVEQVWGVYAIDKWRDQPNYLEVWVEKEALEQVLQTACQPLDVRFFACKGYSSQSALWEAAQRLLVERDKGKEIHIIHLGDHDPSGIDMSRDIYEKLSLFTRQPVDVERIALNMDQVEEYKPPPNNAKQTDSRFQSYNEKYGDKSWELDALSPATLVELIRKAIGKYCDRNIWEEAEKEEQRGRGTLGYICQYFPDVVKFLRERRDKDTSRVICTDCGATEANPKCLCKDKGPTLKLS
jgi:hypothetical protein